MSATANNGMHRAQQQYYHLIVELWANIQKLQEQQPNWIKIAQRVSQPVVVRGRSPGCYQNEGPHSANTPHGPGGSRAGAGDVVGRSFGNGLSMYGNSGLDEDKEKTIEGFDGYQYYPSPIYEAGIPTGAKGEVPAFQDGRRIKEGWETRLGHEMQLGD